MRDLDRPTLAHRLLRRDRHDAQHEGGYEHRQQCDERVVRELREPGLEEALRGVEEKQRDEERPQSQQHRERDAGQREQKDRVDRGQSHDEIDPDPGQVVGQVAAEEPPLLKQQVRRIPALEDDLIDDADRIERPHDDRAKLGGGIEEGVDEETVVEPELQRAPEDHGEREDPLHPIDEGLLDLARQLKIPPDHHVHDAERHDRGLEGRRDPGHVVADVAGEERREPRVEFREEPHGGAVLLKVPSAATAGATPGRPSPARAGAARGPAPPTRRPGRGVGASCARSGACPARR